MQANGIIWQDWEQEVEKAVDLLWQVFDESTEAEQLKQKIYSLTVLEARSPKSMCE